MTRSKTRRKEGTRYKQRLSLSPSLCLFVYLSVCLTVAVSLSLCLSLSPSLSLHLSVCLSLSVSASPCLPLCLACPMSLPAPTTKNEHATTHNTRQAADCAPYPEDIAPTSAWQAVTCEGCDPIAAVSDQPIDCATGPDALVATPSPVAPVQASANVETLPGAGPCTF